MRRPSRLMPALVGSAIPFWLRAVGIALLGVGLVCFVWALWRQPLIVLAGLVAVTLFGIRAERRYVRQLRALARDRTGESICTFTRALPMRELDAWVVRATFEQVQSYLGGTYAAFPLRPSDRLIEDLQIDAEDLDDMLTAEIAQRAGRSMADLEQNPYCGKVVTVEDLVRCFCAQARRAAEQGDEADQR